MKKSFDAANGLLRIGSCRVVFSGGRNPRAWRWERPSSSADCAGPTVPPASGLGQRPSLTSVDGANVALASFENSAFPYHGLIPNYQETGKTRPFLDVDDNGRLGHSSPRGGIHWEDQTYSDRSVLLAAPQSFDPAEPGVIIVFFHGNMATLSRDVVARQQIVRQLADSGLNAVLVAPQLAVDAQDSSAGRFWSPGGFAAFLSEAQTKLGELYPNARGAFRRMPVVIVAYSGGYLPAAYSLAVGGDQGRVRGVVLLDALYGERDKFVSWVEGPGRNAFFVSAYSASSKEGNEAIRAELEADGVQTVSGLPAALTPGVVAFVDAGLGRPQRLRHLRLGRRAAARHHRPHRGIAAAAVMANADRRHADLVFHGKASSFPNPAKLRQRKSKELTLFSLDFFRRIGTFQRVTPTPRQFFLSPPFPAINHMKHALYASTLAHPWRPAPFGARMQSSACSSSRLGA